MAALVNAVFVKGFDEKLNEEKLYGCFSRCGSILTVKVGKDEKGKNLGYAHICFSKTSEAESAIKDLNGIEVGDCKLEVIKYLTPDDLRRERAREYHGRNVFVKNLPSYVGNNELRQLFQHCGTILSAKVMYHEENGTKKSKCHGFVCFSTSEEADKAVGVMDKHMVDNKPLYVSLSQTREERSTYLRQAYQNNLPKGSGFNSGRGSFQNSGSVAAGAIPSAASHSLLSSVVAPFALPMAAYPSANSTPAMASYPSHTFLPTGFTTSPQVAPSSFPELPPTYYNSVASTLNGFGHTLPGFAPACSGVASLSGIPPAFPGFAPVPGMAPALSGAVYMSGMAPTCPGIAPISVQDPALPRVVPIPGMSPALPGVIPLSIMAQAFSGATLVPGMVPALSGAAPKLGMTQALASQIPSTQTSSTCSSSQPQHETPIPWTDYPGGPVRYVRFVVVGQPPWASTTANRSTSTIASGIPAGQVVSPPTVAPVFQSVPM